MVSKIRDALDEQGYCLVRGSEFPIDPGVRSAESDFVSEWAKLEPDNYLRNGARFRERRYGRYYYLPRTNSIQLLKHQPYYQSESANRYAGGIHREVAPLTATSVKNPLMDALIEFNFAQFPIAANDIRRDQPWEVACHQFRIIATPGEVGEPTPEGIHRDEIDFGAIHLLSRSNVNGGSSRVYDNESNLIAEFALESRWDTMYWADQKVLHSVTPITPAELGERAVRDILILGYKSEPDLRETD